MSSAPYGEGNCFVIRQNDDGKKAVGYLQSSNDGIIMMMKNRVKVTRMMVNVQGFKADVVHDATVVVHDVVVVVVVGRVWWKKRGRYWSPCKEQSKT